MLQVEQLSCHYGRIQALDDISLEVREGEIVTLIGANGAGKTSLLMSICGDPKPSAGRVWLHGTPIQDLPTHQIMRMGLAHVPEGRRVFARLTVEENLQLGAFFSPEKRLSFLYDRVYDLFPRLAERRHQRAGTMSGGEQQMLAIGRGLMSQPALLLLDEPSLGLAPIVIQQIFGIIQQLRREGMTIFLVEQNARQALQIADRGYVIETSRLVLSGSGQDLLKSEQVSSAYLGA
jgi:branched-chain amino acid transport system ATP-binding protein